jgi:hypothetical protein
MLLCCGELTMEHRLEQQAMGHVFANGKKPTLMGDDEAENEALKASSAAEVKVVPVVPLRSVPPVIRIY